MTPALPVVSLVRHGQTAWSRSGQHTGRTDLPLTPEGEAAARRLGERLRGMTFKAVFTSPLQRAAHTCELAGFGNGAISDVDLLEWNYGEYEGKRTAEIRASRPDWQIFRDGCPGGESPDEVAARADRMVAKLRAYDGDVLVFSSAHILRMIAARWLGLEPMAGRLLVLDTGSLGALGYEHTRSAPAIRLWNDVPDKAH